MSAVILAAVDAIARLLGHGTTVRSAHLEYGPTPGAVYRDELSKFTDAELYALDRAVILDKIREGKR